MTLSNHYLVANVGFGSAPGQQGRCERRHQLAGHELHRLAAGGRLHRLHGRRPRRARRGDARGGAEPRHGFYDSHTGEHAIPAAVHLLAGAAVRGGGGVQGAHIHLGALSKAMSMTSFALGNYVSSAPVASDFFWLLAMLYIGNLVVYLFIARWYGTSTRR
jgi:hypothetical protein